MRGIAASRLRPPSVMDRRTVAETCWNIVMVSRDPRAAFKHRLFFDVVLLVLVVLVVIVLIFVSAIVVVIARSSAAVQVVMSILCRGAILGRKFAILLALVLPLLHPLPLSPPLFFHLPLLPLLDLVCPSQSLRRVSKDPLVFAEVADPKVFALGRVPLVIELCFSATRLGRSQVFLGSAPARRLPGRRSRWVVSACATPRRRFHGSCIRA